MLRRDSGCGRRMALAMYASYLVLFVSLFVNKYTKKTKKKVCLSVPHFLPTLAPLAQVAPPCVRVDGGVV